MIDPVLRKFGRGHGSPNRCPGAFGRQVRSLSIKLWSMI
jgi:hypothetical protein